MRTSRRPPPRQAKGHDAEKEQRVPEQVAPPLVRLMHQDERPFQADAPGPSRGPSEPPGQVMKQPPDPDAEITAETMGVAVNPRFLQGIPEPHQEHASAGPVDDLRDPGVVLFTDRKSVV